MATPDDKALEVAIQSGKQAVHLAAHGTKMLMIVEQVNLTISKS